MIEEMKDRSTDVLQILKTYFGYTEFREGQEEIIREILNGRDILAVMPDRGRKVDLLSEFRR